MPRHVERWGGMEMWNGGVPYPHVVKKIGRDTLGARDPSHIPDHPAQGSRARMINPHNFWL